MAIKKNEYNAFTLDGDELMLSVLYFEDVKERNPSGFPTTYFSEDIMEEGIEAFILFEMCGLCNTRGEGRRLLKQGGGYKHVHGTKAPIEFQTIKAHNETITIEDFEGGILYLRAGKKKLHRLELL